MGTDMPPPSLVLPRRNGGLRRAAGDAGVQKTNDDAQATKISCAQLGYFKDELLPLLAKCRPSRKSPLINRGTWARHAAIKQVVTDFVTACTLQAQNHQLPQHQQQEGRHHSTAAIAGRRPLQDHQQQHQPEQQQVDIDQPVCQIVVLGAGSDSSWFNLRHQGSQLVPAVHYIEVDYQEIVSKKARTILTTQKLLHLLPDRTTATTASAAAAAGATAESNQHHLSVQHETWTKQTAAACAHTANAPPASAEQLAAGHSISRQQKGPEELLRAAVAVSAEPPAAVSSHVQEITGPLYSLVSADIRHSALLEAALQRAGFDVRLPTLYVSECVLVYLEPSEAQEVLAAAAARATAAGSSAAVVIYEQTRPNDAFGATMISNLEARGCPLRSVTAVPTPEAQCQRLRDSGWDQAAAADMAAVYYGRGGTSIRGSCGSWLRPEWQQERARIERLELLDELEEWHLLQEHYVLVLGVRGDSNGWLAESFQLQQLRDLRQLI